MDKETKQKIQEALALLSTKRVNTSGLGAPINILKRLLEDSEVPPVPDKIPSAEEFLIQHLINRCEENSTVKISDEEIAEILDDPEMIAFVQMIESYASLAVEYERQKWQQESIQSNKLLSNAINRLSVLKELISIHLTEKSTKFVDSDSRMDIELFQSRVEGIKSILNQINNGK